ncbi:MAG: hypothetical protein ACXITV_08680 [Luteibaculaceae bacterium]
MKVVRKIMLFEFKFLIFLLCIQQASIATAQINIRTTDLEFKTGFFTPRFEKTLADDFKKIAPLSIGNKIVEQNNLTSIPQIGSLSSRVYSFGLGFTVDKYNNNKPDRSFKINAELNYIHDVIVIRDEFFRLNSFSIQPDSNIQGNIFRDSINFTEVRRSLRSNSLILNFSLSKEIISRKKIKVYGNLGLGIGIKTNEVQIYSTDIYYYRLMSSSGVESFIGSTTLNPLTDSPNLEYFILERAAYFNAFYKIGLLYTPILKSDKRYLNNLALIFEFDNGIHTFKIPNLRQVTDYFWLARFGLRYQLK